MKDLRKNFERFCLKNRDRGIPNLMLVIAIGNLIAYALSVIDPSRVVYRFLCFSPSKILHGQIWRLFTYVFTYLLDVSGSYLFLAVISLFCYYQFGKMLENYWGVCRFNLYYLTGVLLCDLAGLLLGYNVNSTDLNLSLFLAVATLAPETRMLLMMFIPIKIKYLAWVDLAFTAVNVVFLLLAGPLSFYWLMPLVPLANYFLFFGSDVQNLFPNSWRYRRPKQHNPGPYVTSRKPVSGLTATSAPSAAEPTPTIRTLSSATARSATATTATAWTTSTTTSTSSNSAKAPQAAACGALYYFRSCSISSFGR